MLAPIRLTNAGSCPSRQRDCVSTAARAAETKGTAQLRCGSGETQGDASPPHSTPPPPLRGLSNGSQIGLRPFHALLPQTACSRVPTRRERRRALPVVRTSFPSLLGSWLLLHPCSGMRRKRT